MKLIIQIPCYNEEETLPQTLADLPKEIKGVEVIETLVIDDGSTDRTSEVAKNNGVNYVVRFSAHLGLAAAFRVGIQKALECGADIIVNTDADNQYRGDNIEKLVRPIIDGNADMVIGDRQIWQHKEFGVIKKLLQKLGSWVVGRLAGITVPDVASGFRAYSREAALHLNVLSNFTYTHETIIQAGLNNLKVLSVPVQVNPTVRPSRLFGSTFSYLYRSTATIMRIYTFYRPLKVFLTLALIPFVAGFGLGLRFLIYYLFSQGQGHLQSLVLCAVLLNLSFLLFVLGVLADLTAFNRRFLEETLYRSRKATFNQPNTVAATLKPTNLAEQKELTAQVSPNPKM